MVSNRWNETYILLQGKRDDDGEPLFLVLDRMYIYFLYS
jgi:hypothetical protein